MATFSLDAIDFKRQDPEGMYEHIANFVPTFLQWWKKADEFPLPAYFVKIDKIVLSGMGGSAQGGSIAKDLILSTCKVPVEIVREYHLPPWVDQNTLVIAVSHSGTTEETVSTFIEGYEKGAKLLGIGTGGQIASLARKYKAPYLEHDYRSQPRAALAVHLAILLNFFKRLGLVDLSDEDLSSLTSVQKAGEQKWVASIPEGTNEAKQLATKLSTKVPIIVGDGVLASVATRLKAQFNENAKSPAYAEILPEMNHNALVGTEMPKEAKDWLFFILLDSTYTEERNKTRMMLTEQLLKDRRYGVTRLDFGADTPLSEVITAIHFGDFVSYYLALLHQVEPTGVPVINDFKSKLSR